MTNTSSLWNALRARMPGSSGRGPARRQITVHHLGLGAAELGPLQAAFERLGDELSVQFALRHDSGELVLLDAAMAQRMAPSMRAAVIHGRPVLTLSGAQDASDAGLGELERAARRFERVQQQLLQQLRGLQLVDGSAKPATALPDPAQPAAARMPVAPNSGSHASTSGWRHSEAFDSAFDSRVEAGQPAAADLHPAQHELLQLVRQGVHDPTMPVLNASYGPNANMRLDFRQRYVMIDRLAQRHLRVDRHLPRVTPGAQPQADAMVRELDDVAWDIGLASGAQDLQDAPADWWHVPVASPTTAAVHRYTRLPRHLALARELAAGPVTPSELRRLLRVGVGDLRAFLQACLMLRQVYWEQDGTPTQPMPLEPLEPGSGSGRR